MTGSSDYYSKLLAQEVLSRGHCIRVKGRGQSMYPLVRTGDTLDIEPKDPGELKIGDIIFYRRFCGDYVAHRLIKRNGPSTLLTKGDNHYYYDMPVPVDAVLGRVIRIEKEDRQLILSGNIAGILGRISAWLARGRSRKMTRLWRNMGRVIWFIGGRHKT